MKQPQLFSVYVGQSFVYKHVEIDGLVQDFSDSIANALALLQSCARPSK